jgi:hypothetical protein
MIQKQYMVYNIYNHAVQILPLYILITNGR